MRFLLIALAALVFLSACGRKDETINEPTELSAIDATHSLNRAWSFSVGDQRAEQRLGLSLQLVGERLYAASARGDLHAINPENGSRYWSISTDYPFSGGPGADGNTIAVGTRDGRVIAFSADDGTELWQRRVASEVLSAPAVGDGRVVVRTVNGATYGLDASSGERVWQSTRDVPALTLRGNASPLLRAGVAVIGHDNGRVTALRVRDGEPVWDHLVSEPSGRGELARLNDVNGALAWVGADLYAVNYQGRLVSLNAATGSVGWVRDFSSYQGVSADRTSLFLSDASSEVWGVDRRSGASLWRQDGLKYRHVSVPAVAAGVVAVADLEGYIHLLDYDSGEFVGRVRHSKSPIRSAMLSRGDKLFVLDADGRLTAWRVREG